MWDVRACVACLATDVRMYSMSANSLLQPYQLLAGVQIGHGMPQKLCWECAALVNKFNLFRHKCQRAYLLLQDIYNQHDEIMEHHVKKIDRGQHNLSSPLSVTRVTTLKKRSVKKSKNSKKKTIEPDFKEEIEIPLVKTEEVIVKCEPELHFEPFPIVDDFQAADDLGSEIDTKDVDVLSEAEDALIEATIQKKVKVKKNPPPEELGWIEMVMTQEQMMEAVQERQASKSYKNGRIKCTLCFKVFLEENTYKNHMLRHDPVSGNVECDICKIRLKNRRKMYRHMTNVHTKSYSCKICPIVSCTRKAAQDHYQRHKGVRYMCHVCGAAFNRYDAMANHVHKKHGSLAPSHICCDCGSSFPSEKGLRDHKGIMHRIVTVPEENAPYCDDCKVQFSSTEAWNKHIIESDRHEDLKKEKFPESVQRKKEFAPKRPRRPRGGEPGNKIRKGPEPCMQCGEMMATRRQYREHFQLMHPGLVYRPPAAHVCEQCGRHFKCQALLRQHSVVHTGEREFRCNLCPKAFYTQVVLNSHSMSHSEHRPFKCDVCEKAFKVKAALARHSLVHSGEKPFVCNVCGQAFTTRHWTQLHVRKVHNNEHIPYKPRIRKRKGRVTHPRDPTAPTDTISHSEESM